MPLLTIADLKNEQPETVAQYIQWAEEFKGIWDKFITDDNEDVSYTVSWGAAKSREAGLHASELSGCKRKAVYSLMAMERKEVVSPFWKLKFRAGHAIHAMLQNDLHRLAEKSNGLYSFDSELKIKPELQAVAEEYEIYSSCDGVFTFNDDVGGEPLIRVGLEIKSESPDQWAGLKEPRPYHKEQSMVYMKCLDLPLMWTVYFNKGTQSIVPSRFPWLFTYSEATWNELEKRMQASHEAAEKKELPERTEGITCEFCPYSYDCKPEYLERKAKSEAAKAARAKRRKANPHKGRITAPRSAP